MDNTRKFQNKILGLIMNIDNLEDRRAILKFMCSTKFRWRPFSFLVNTFGRDDTNYWIRQIKGVFEDNEKTNSKISKSIIDNVLHSMVRSLTSSEELSERYRQGALYACRYLKDYIHSLPD